MFMCDLPLRYCSPGSVVVHYELAVKKTEAAETMNTIVQTIERATSEGNFGNFAIDPQSIKATSEYCKDFLLIETCLFMPL